MKRINYFFTTTAILLLLTHTTFSAIYVKRPKSLRVKFKDKYDNEGNIEHTISTFGYLDYQSKIRMTLRKWNTDDGCNPPDKSLFVTEEDNTRGAVAFIMKRGGCTYYKKAQNVHRAGGRLAIVMFNSENEDPEGVIPIGPKQRRFIFLMFFLESDVIPPLILIKKKDGDILNEELNKGTNVVLHVDFDMVKKIEN